MGYCAAHAQRVRRTGKPGSPQIAERQPRPQRVCAVSECGRPHYCRGMCTTHYQRERKHGSTVRPEHPAGPNHHSWRGSDVGYRAVHTRLTADRGSASAFACVDCGGRAEQWSYDNLDPDERHEPGCGTYSLNLDHYSARCRRCHHAYDCRTSATHVHDERLCAHTT